MAPRTKYNLDIFRNLIKKGKTKSAIMAEMSIKNGATFSGLLLRLMETDKKYYAVKGSSRKSAAKKALKVTIGKNKNLTLSSKMLNDTGFKPGQSFNVKSSKNKIVLTLIEVKEN